MIFSSFCEVLSVCEQQYKLCIKFLILIVGNSKGELRGKIEGI